MADEKFEQALQQVRQAIQTIRRSPSRETVLRHEGTRVYAEVVVQPKRVPQSGDHRTRKTG